MQCERCNKKKATVFYRENAGGRIKALRLCGDCLEILEQTGELEDISAAVAGFISPFFVTEDYGISFPFPTPGNSPPRMGGTVSPKKCSACGATTEDIYRSGRVGCAHCYGAFAEELADVLDAAHGRTEHRGRISAGYRARAEKTARLARLKKQLKEAVSTEQYEAAAGLRDEIRGLEAEL